MVYSRGRLPRAVECVEGGASGAARHLEVQGNLPGRSRPRESNGAAVLITRFGKPVAEVVPPSPSERPEQWLGCMRSTLRITGDIVSPALRERNGRCCGREAPAGHARLDLERRRTGAVVVRRPHRVGIAGQRDLVVAISVWEFLILVEKGRLIPECRRGSGLRRR